MMRGAEAGDYVGRCHALAALLEASAYPKPGNVHRLRDGVETRYEHFLAGSVATTPALRDLASRAHYGSCGGDWGSLGLGEAILQAVKEMLTWQRGGNVHLGVVLLHAPIAAAAGAAYEEDGIPFTRIRESLTEVVAAATPRDTVNIYKAIDLAMTRRTLGEVGELDVSDESSLEVIEEEGLTPVQVFELCKDRDTICSEWVDGFTVTFEEGHRHLSHRLEEGETVNSAIVETFLYLLSRHPDSLIIRKSGMEKAKEVSVRAAQVLRRRGEPGFMEEVRRMDEELWSADGELNPGTTADLTAASIFVQLLTGWRP
jgi:triphosphoribosyl-dephospho-CoA synthase